MKIPHNIKREEFGTAARELWSHGDDWLDALQSIERAMPNTWPEALVGEQLWETGWSLPRCLLALGILLGWELRTAHELDELRNAT